MTWSCGGRMAPMALYGPLLRGRCVVSFQDASLVRRAYLLRSVLSPRYFSSASPRAALLGRRDALYITEPNHQEIDRVTRNGEITRVVDLSTLFVPPANWQGATGIAYRDGKLYFGTLGTFPVRPGTENVYTVNRKGHVTVAASGLTTVLGVTFDHQGRLYALETDTVAGLPGPAAAGTGTVVRVNRDGTLTTIATGLVFPTAMTIGPDNALYVSNGGFGIPVAGAGQIVRITLPGGRA